MKTTSRRDPSATHEELLAKLRSLKKGDRLLGFGKTWIVDRVSSKTRKFAVHREETESFLGQTVALDYQEFSYYSLEDMRKISPARDKKRVRRDPGKSCGSVKRVGDIIQAHAPGSPWHGRMGTITAVDPRRNGSIRYTAQIPPFQGYPRGREIFLEGRSAT